MSQKEPEDNRFAEPNVPYNNIWREESPYFIDPLGDLGFKRLFSAEQNKEITITFINHVLQGKHHILSLEFIKNEYPGETQEEGSAIIDVVCKDHDGAVFLVEIQRNWQQNFKNRTLFYASRLITEQAPRGNRKQWAYALKDVYVIALLDKFTVNAGNKGTWMHDVELVNSSTGVIFNERLRFTYIELRSFNKEEHELTTELEKWIYALKNLRYLQAIPDTFTEPTLLQFCQAARYINLTKEEKQMISQKTKNRWDYYNTIDGAKIIGREEGQAIGEALGEIKGRTEGSRQTAIQVAIKLKNEGFSLEKIAEITELSLAEIEEL